MSYNRTNLIFNPKLLIPIKTSSSASYVFNYIFPEVIFEKTINFSEEILQFFEKILKFSEKNINFFEKILKFSQKIIKFFEKIIKF